LPIFHAHKILVRHFIVTFLRPELYEGLYVLLTLITYFLQALKLDFV